MTLERTARGLAPGAWRPVLDAAAPLPPLPGPGTPVTVVAAHPDDETLGTSCLLQRLARQGNPVTVVLATDGEAAYAELPAAGRPALAATRRAETRDALGRLGLAGARTVHLGLPDTGLAAHEEELAARLAEVLPGDGLHLLPWRHDPHPDHAAASRAARAALGGALGGALGAAVAWEYPVWMRHSTPPGDPRVTGLRVARLSAAEAAVRRHAVAAHRSQVEPAAARGAVLPGHVLELFDDGVEPWFV